MPVIRERTQVFNQPVGVRRVNSGSRELWQTISSTAAEISEVQFRKAAKEADQRGIDTALGIEAQRLTTINPETGKPEAFAAPEGFGSIATDAYQRVINKRYESSMLNELEIKSSEMASKHQYDPKGYDQSMSQYIAAMSENAEGRYKQIIVENGQNRLASEMINIKNRVRVRARSNAAASISAGVSRGADAAYNAALAGDFEGSREIAISESENANNGTIAGLLKRGAGAAALEKINSASAMGAVEYIHGLATTSSERNAIDLFILTGGKRRAGLRPELKNIMEPILGYITRNNKGAVLSHSSRIAVDYNAVEQDQNIAAEAKAKVALRRQSLTYGEVSTGEILTANSIASMAFDPESGMTISGAISSNVASLNLLKSNSENRFMAGSMTLEQMNSQTTSDRQGLLRTLVIEASADGNVVEFRAALASRNPDDMESLSSSQVELINELQNSPLFVASEDTAYVQGLVSSTTNAARMARDKAQATSNAIGELTDLGVEFAQSSITPEVLADAKRRIDSGVGTLFTIPQAVKEKSRIGIAAAYGQLNLFAKDASAASLNRLSSYIDTNGERTDGMSPSEIATGNYMLNATGPDDVSTLTGRINGLRSNVSMAESAEAKSVKREINVNRVLTGQGSMASAPDRKLLSEVLESRFVDLSKYNSFQVEDKSQLLNIFRSTFPQSGIDALNAIASGQEVEGSESYLNLFTTLSSDLTVSGTRINRLSLALGGPTSEFLTDVIEIQRNTGRSVAEISQELRARRDDPASKAIAHNTLGKVSPSDFAFAVFDDIITATEFASTIEYMALTGKSSDQIENRINDILDAEYPEVKFIADPRMPLGTMKRSRHGLEATFPNDQVRQAFISHVESSLSGLPKLGEGDVGYSLFADSSLVAMDFLGLGNPTQEQVDTVTERSIKKQVFLVPNPSVSGTAYYAYFVNEYNELQPIPYQENGLDAIPQFDQSDVSAFREDLAATEAAKVEEALDRQEMFINALRGRTGINR